MSLAPGTRLGPYEIVSAIGAGGMGEVYRARDTRLGREVALKVLPEPFAADAERMARFEREAKVLASLNHPNIATIYGLEESDGVRALVMELIAGPTLAECIAQGPIPLDEALPIAKQIAEGLEYAHERGIVHRDLKPANVKITPDGVVKLLDFGLAKALEGDVATTTDPSASPTLSHLATQAGIILGTAAYMSPEQAKGRAVDRRSDIWAFACVQYEMLTGRPAFEGETVSDVLAAVIRAEPDWSALPEHTPLRIRDLLQRCLKKDARQRIQAIGDARIAIEEAASGNDQYSFSSAPIGAEAPGKLRALPWVLAGTLALALATALILSPLASRAPAPPAVISQIDPPASTVFVAHGGYFATPALSPDGKRLAFVATGANGVQQLWLRSLDSSMAQAIEGTEDGEFPFWSPDGRSLGYFAKGKLYRVDLSGGSPFALADAPFGRGGTWGPDGTILFSPNLNSAILRVPASGGTARPATELSPSRRDFSHRWPQFLPDGKHFLFYVWSADIQKSAVYAGSLDGSERKLVLQNDSAALYAPPGYLLFVRQGALMAQRFDLSSLRVSGDMQPVATGATLSLIPSTFIPPVTASGNGILVYGTGIPTGPLRLLWFDRRGRQIGESGEPAYYETPSISPQGDKLAVSVGDAQTPGDIWVFDLRNGLKRRINFSNSFNVAPHWSADGKTLEFVSNRGGTKVHLYQKPADGTGATAPLFADKALEDAADGAEWTSDGRYLVFGRSDMETIFAMPLFGDRKPFPVLKGLHGRVQLAASPDGKWLAYVGQDSGESEVDVVPFPRGSGRWQVSTNGGSLPRWRGDGKELFYVSPDFRVMAAEVSGEGATFRVGKVVPLFKLGSVTGGDVSPDGKKFVFISQGEQKAGHALTLVTNWPALLKRQ